MPVSDRRSLSSSVDPSAAGAAPRARPLVVELVGPAGAGKTALLRAAGRAPRIRAGVRIERMRLLPAFLLNAVRMIPLGVELLSRGREHVWRGLLHFMRLRTLPRTVIHVAALGQFDAILLDEGPVFSLGRLSVFQEADQGDGRVASAWNRELDRWATLLDAVIWIDAPDPVLAERIRVRSKHHQIKSHTDAEITEFLRRYREAYRRIRERLTASGRVKMVQLDTGGLPLDTAAERLLGELERLGVRRRD